MNQKVKRAKFKEFDSESRKNLLTYPYIDRINQIINYKGNYLYLNHKFGYLVSINDKDGNYDETILETIGDDLEEILKNPRNQSWKRYNNIEEIIKTEQENFQYNTKHTITIKYRFQNDISFEKYLDFVDFKNKK